MKMSKNLYHLWNRFQIQCQTIDLHLTISTVMYLNYGPFSSYGPQYDSTFANMSKEESDLLLSTYADETGVQYAKR